MRRLNIPNGGLTGFYGLVIAGFGFTIKQNALMQMPTVRPYELDFWLRGRVSSAGAAL